MAAAEFSDGACETTSTPMQDEPLHVGRPNIADRERFLGRVNDLLDRRWLSNNGPFVQELEKAVAESLGVKHCICTCNGTVALGLVIRALGMEGEVILPSFTFIATAHALQWQEITPVFCDLDPKTHNIDPDRIEELITPRTSGIIGVHIWGRPCNTHRLTDIARKHDLSLLFDASHAFSNTHHGRMIGSFGDAEVFSFHATKFFNTFEGGAIVTNNDELAEKLLYMKNFGFAGLDRVEHLGTNGKMTEICAAMGLTNLESIDEFIAANKRNYDAYREGLSGLPGVSLIQYDEREKRNYQYIVLEIDEQAAGVSRDDLIAALHAHNILARRYFYPGCHRMEPYRSYYPQAGLLLPETEGLCDRVLLLPTGTSVGQADIEAICGLLRAAVPQPHDVREALHR